LTRWRRWRSRLPRHVCASSGLGGKQPNYAPPSSSLCSVRSAPAVPSHAPTPPPIPPTGRYAMPDDRATRRRPSTRPPTPPPRGGRAAPVPRSVGTAVFRTLPTLRSGTRRGSAVPIPRHTPTRRLASTRPSSMRCNRRSTTPFLDTALRSTRSSASRPDVKTATRFRYASRASSHPVAKRAATVPAFPPPNQ